MRTAVSVVLIAVAWTRLASAQTPSSCDFVLQSDRDTLKECIDELRKEIERIHLEMQMLKTNNTLLSKQLCMMAIEQHRNNANSEALKLIVENACVQFKNSTVPERRS